MSFRQEKSDAKCINGVPVVFEISFRYEDKVSIETNRQITTRESATRSNSSNYIVRDRMKRLDHEK